MFIDIKGTHPKTGAYIFYTLLNWYNPMIWSFSRLKLLLKYPSLREIINDFLGLKFLSNSFLTSSILIAIRLSMSPSNTYTHYF